VHTSRRMPTSDKQIAANRANSQKSTGAKTETGRRNSSRDSARHVILSGVVLIEGESRECFATLVNSLHPEYQPETSAELQHVEKAAVALLSYALPSKRTCPPRSETPIFAASVRRFPRLHPRSALTITKITKRTWIPLNILQSISCSHIYWRSPPAILALFREIRPETAFSTVSTTARYKPLFSSKNRLRAAIFRSRLLSRGQIQNDENLVEPKKRSFFALKMASSARTHPKIGAYPERVAVTSAKPCLPTVPLDETRLHPPASELH
jgi:hypothetical protein